MQINLKGISIVVLGGDARSLAMMEDLTASGAVVNAAGMPADVIPAGVHYFSEPEACLAGAGAVILPVPGMSEKGYLHSPLAAQPLAFTEDLAARFPPGIPVFVGVAGPALAKIAANSGLRLIELMKMNEVAILNSIPTAEGAVQMAMEMLPITIHGSCAFVLGFGRTGATLARLLGSMGARTMVAARRPEYLARITELNLTPVPFADMPHYLDEADVIFNTVPVPVLTGEVLEKVHPGTLIIDLASAPGGVDFQRAESIGVKAVLAPGLPGKVAPKTAGRILAKVVIRLLHEEMAGN
ncbi:dipicolinate synthase subunit DpsA [Pelotomaculum propionicicum]|uniref:dipicolinate synthase subunit DpsA n=1 Tax=Pelotomaculum propionicicum TaxID=258475 RepID=UPI003B778F11